MNKVLMQVYVQRALLCVVVGICYAVSAPHIGHLPHLTWWQAACAYCVVTEIIGAVKQ
jgi:hypothetical protein